MKNNKKKTSGKLNRWTQSAIDCYSLGCRCSMCSLHEIIGDRCRMKTTVIKLVTKFGKPKQGKKHEEKD